MKQKVSKLASTSFCLVTSVLLDSDRIAEYDMKLMDIDTDQLGIPDTEYDARITMPAAEFTRIVRDLSLLGESVRIEVSKEGIRFTSEGEAANGNVLLKHSDGKIGKVRAKSDADETEGDKSKVKDEKDDDVEMEDEQEPEVQPNSGDDGEEEEEEGEGSEKNKKRKKKVRVLFPLFHLTFYLQLSYKRPRIHQGNQVKRRRRKSLKMTMTKPSILK